jgi:Protein of unknown function (DUF3313)
MLVLSDFCGSNAMAPTLLRTATRTLALSCALLANSCATPAAKLPDGLQPVPQSGFRDMYSRQDVAWERYTAVAILDCTVEFRKNWQRDQNEDNPFSVTDQDVERIKTTLAAEFRKVFSQELAARGEKIVAEGGPGVLALRPAIIDLDIIAPDTNALPNEVTLADSAGSMTLYLEIYDAATDELLARIIDPRESIEFGNFTARNDVTNLNDARRLLEKWATLLGDFLTAASKPEGSTRGLPPTS